MSVKPRGTSFQATVHHKGERYRKDFDTERNALIWEAETKAKLLKGLPIEGSKANEAREANTMEALVAKCERLHWDRLKGSYKAVMNAKVFANWVGLKLSPTKALTQDNVEKFVTHLIEERKVANSTINRYMSALSVMLNHTKLDEKPTLPWYKPGKGRVRFFSDAEEALIIQTWTRWGFTREVDFFITLLDTGMRPWAEGAAFPWRDLNNRKVTLWDTKNDDSRTIPLTTRAWEAINRQDRELEGPFHGIDTAHMQRLWDRTQNHLPMLNDAVIYTARHTCASRMVQRGVELTRVKMWMGHRSITTTLIYAHLAPDHLMDGVEALERGNVKSLTPRHKPHLVVE